MSLYGGLSAKTDLTEHGDFMLHRIIPMISRETIDEINNLRDAELVTADEYDKISYFESMFGKQKYNTAFYRIFRKIFRKSEEEFEIEMKTHCQRCGRSLRAPWKNFYGLCQECDRIISNEDYRKFPWNSQLLALDDNTARDLFSLR